VGPLNKRERQRWLKSIERANQRVAVIEADLAGAKEDLVEEIRLARQEGIKPDDIAEVLGIHRDSVSRLAPLRKNKRRAS